MNADDFNELAGRIEAISRVVLHLAAALEEGGVIDGPLFTQQLRTSLRPRLDASAHLHGARARLLELADRLDDARRYRR
jgi:hypothetical protein